MLLGHVLPNAKMTGVTCLGSIIESITTNDDEVVSVITVVCVVGASVLQMGSEAEV